ncbi:hypothetical protein [Pectobacterium versatile]|uniref:hypothetical protein n=1 Tax=Pectobacterium versatile TaxID=2488639 RepID=UPI001F28EF72|nr:hypothetical protein [Pectobacterium versatile]
MAANAVWRRRNIDLKLQSTVTVKFASLLRRVGVEKQKAITRIFQGCLAAFFIASDKYEIQLHWIMERREI